MLIAVRVSTDLGQIPVWSYMSPHVRSYIFLIFLLGKQHAIYVDSARRKKWRFVLFLDVIQYRDNIYDSRKPYVLSMTGRNIWKFHILDFIYQSFYMVAVYMRSMCWEIIYST